MRRKGGTLGGLVHSLAGGLRKHESPGGSLAVAPGRRKGLPSGAVRRTGPWRGQRVPGAPAPPAAGLAHVPRPARGPGVLERAWRKGPAGRGKLGGRVAVSDAGARGRRALAAGGVRRAQAGLPAAARAGQREQAGLAGGGDARRARHADHGPQPRPQIRRGPGGGSGGLGLRAGLPADLRGLRRQGQLRHRAHERRFLQPPAARPGAGAGGRGDAGSFRLVAAGRGTAARGA